MDLSGIVAIFGGGPSAGGPPPRNPDHMIFVNDRWKLGVAGRWSWMRAMGWSFSADQAWMKRASRDEEYLSRVPRDRRVGLDTGARIPQGVFGRVIRGVECHEVRWARDLSEPIWMGNNSGLAAIGLADAAGAEEIHLLGFDLDGRDYDGTTSEAKRKAHDLFVRRFEAAAPLIRARVIDHSWSRRLQCFNGPEVLCSS